MFLQFTPAYRFAFLQIGILPRAVFHKPPERKTRCGKRTQTVVFHTVFIPQARRGSYPHPRPLRRSRAKFPLLSPTVTSSPGAGEVFPLRESQAVKFITKVLGITRTLPAVLLALPLGELAKPTALTERAHAASLVTNVSKAIKNFAATTKSRPLEGVLHKKCRAVRRPSGIALFFTSYCGTPAVRFGNRGSGCRRPRWW